MPFRVNAAARSNNCIAVRDASRSPSPLRMKRENAFMRIEELTKIIATELRPPQLPPIVKRIDTRIAAHCVGNEPLGSIGSVFAALGEAAHAPVLARDDAASVDRRRGMQELQVGALASNKHGCDLQGAE